jgi:hypothetical protein
MDQTPFPSPPSGTFSWEINIPLITNRFILYDLVKMLGLAFLIIGALFFPVFLWAGIMPSFIPILGLFAGCLVFFGLILSLVMLFFFTNRFPASFSISTEGIEFKSISKRGKGGNRGAVLAGILGKNPALSGAGLLGLSREKGKFSWREIHRVKYHPRSGVITLMNRWRVLLRLYCSLGDFSVVAARVKAATEK